MRLLYIAHCFPPPAAPLDKIGGMQRVGLDLLQALRQREDIEVETHVLATAGWWHAVSYIGFLFTTIVRVRRAVRRRQVDAVLFSAMPSGMAAFAAAAQARAAGVPLAVIAHGHDVTMPLGLYQWLVPKVLARVDAVLAVSRATGEACLARGLPPDKLFVIPNGIEPDRFQPAGASPHQNAASRRAELLGGLPALAGAVAADALVLCAVGRQIRRKGHAWFVENVMPCLPDHVHLVLGGHGPEAPAIAEAASRVGVGHRVHALGRITETQLAALYLGADLFIMPNIVVPGDMEGFGVVMLEAGLCGMPVIAARLEGIQDVIAEDRNGHLVTSGDAEAFVHLIERYDRDRTALAAMAGRARAHVLANFTWPVIADRYADCLHKLIARRG